MWCSFCRVFTGKVEQCARPRRSPGIYEKKKKRRVNSHSAGAGDDAQTSRGTRKTGGVKGMHKQGKKRAKKGEPQRITKAVTHIRLAETNSGKLAALDQLAHVFLPLVQQYVTLFCTDEMPDAFRAPCFPTELSARWHRVVIQQAAGIAKSWRTNRAAAFQSYADELAEYQE